MTGWGRQMTSHTHGISQWYKPWPVSILDSCRDWTLVKITPIHCVCVCVGWTEREDRWWNRWGEGGQELFFNVRIEQVMSLSNLPLFKWCHWNSLLHTFLFCCYENCFFNVCNFPLFLILNVVFFFRFIIFCLDTESVLYNIWYWSLNKSEITKWKSPWYCMLIHVCMNWPFQLAAWWLWEMCVTVGMCVF